MSEWKKVKFLDFIVLQRGFDLTKDSIKDGPYPVVCSTSIMGYHNNYKVEGPGVVTGRSGTLGETQYVKGNFWPHNTTLFVKDFKGNNRQFVYYFLKNFDIASMGGGAAIPSLNRNVLSNLSVTIPDLSIQNNIATILSRYDSLIENYQKQIKLLEESAQRLYKEWFIDLRFSGHENTKIVNGVPEGWEKAKLGTLVEFKRGKTITKKEAVDGNIPVVAGGLEPAYYCNKSNTSERVITISASGANAGYTKMYFEKVWASDCSFADNSMTPYLHFIFCFLRDNKTTLDNMQKGSAQPHVYAKDINAMELCLPETSILQTFEEKVSKCFDNISSLIFQIRHLTEARDCLLPKLMSGEKKV